MLKTTQTHPVELNDCQQRASKHKIWKTINFLQGQLTECKTIIEKQNKRIAKLERRKASNRYPARIIRKIFERFNTLNKSDPKPSIWNPCSSCIHTADTVTRVDSVERDIQLFPPELDKVMSKIEELSQQNKAMTEWFADQIVKFKTEIGYLEANIPTTTRKSDVQSRSNEKHGQRDQSPFHLEKGFPHKISSVPCQSSANFPKKKILCVYSDQMLYTDSALKKLEDELLKDYEVQSLSKVDLYNCWAKPFDKAFFFYFFIPGREQDQAINDITSRISEMGYGKPIYLIIFKDPNSGEARLDPQRINVSSNNIKTYTIYNEGYAKPILYIDKSQRCMSTDYVTKVNQNYELLIRYIKDAISCHKI